MNHDDTFKANYTPDNTPPRNEIEARIVAWVLGEASPFEVAELERLCAVQPELAVFKNRISAVHGLVATSAKPVESTLRLSADRRAKLLSILGSSEKVEGDLRAPLNPTPQSDTLSAQHPAPQTTTDAVGQLAPHPSAKPAPQSAKPQSAPQSLRRKSNVVAFASTMRQWAMPIAACFVLLLLVSATFAPKAYRASKAQFALEPVTEFSFVAGEKQGQVVETTPMLQNPFTPAAVVPALSGSGSADRDLVDSASPFDRMKVGNKNGWFFDSAQNGQQAKATGGRAPLPDASAEHELRANKLSGNIVSLEGQSTSSGTGIGSIGVGFATGSISSAPTTVNFSSAASPAVAADPFATPPPSTEGSLEVVSSTMRARRSNEVGKDMAAKRAVDATADAKLSAKGRSQYLAGDSDGAQETFRQIEANNPANAEAKSFLTLIAHEKAKAGELKRDKIRAANIEEVSNAWQRPEVHVSSSAPADPSSEWKPSILGKDRDKDDASSITITAGTPQKFYAFKLTDSERKEVERRARQKRAERTVGPDAEGKQVGAKSYGPNDGLFEPYGSSGFFRPTKEYSAALAEVTAEIKAAEAKAAEAKAAQAEAEAAEKADARAIPPTAAIDPKVLESFRAELAAKDEAMSTFSLHVSDASYRLAKDALAKGMAPNPDTIRPEEFYNAFDYGDPAPVTGEPVAARIEQSAHPFMQQRNLVRIAMRVPAVGRGASQPLRLTVMLDTSGSMEREDRAATVRAALSSLTSLLGPNDRVTLIGFARTPRLIAENVAGDKASVLLEAAAKTPSEGGTNLEEALRLAETQALRQYTDGAQNRIVLLTDGATNLGDADPVSLAARIEKLRQRGVAFDACGIVAEGLNDNVLESLTRKGDGRYAIINSPEDADANFARQLAGAFRPAAKDVKVQVHFNPARVARYRLIGFEQHRLKTEDFRNDAVDAAELASEEAATALYQVEVLPEGEGELGEVSVRFLDTNTNQRVERSWTIAYDAKPPAFAKASALIQLAGSAAFLAEKLRGGELGAQFRLGDFAPVVNGLATAYPDSASVHEFITMFQQARRVTGD